MKFTPERGRGRADQAAAHSLAVLRSVEWANPARSIRGGLLLTAVATIVPLVAFASGMALLRAYSATGLSTAAAWVTAAAAPVLIGVAAILILSIAVEALVMQWLGYLQRLSRALLLAPVPGRRLAAAPAGVPCGRGDARRCTCAFVLIRARACARSC